MKSEHMSTLFCCVYVGKFLHSQKSSAGLLSRSVQIFVRTPCAPFTHVFTFYDKKIILLLIKFTLAMFATQIGIYLLKMAMNCMQHRLGTVVYKYIIFCECVFLISSL